MVQVLSGPEKRQVRCSKCGAHLEYTEMDVESYFSQDYTGFGETTYHITCPVCKHKPIVTRR